MVRWARDGGARRNLLREMNFPLAKRSNWSSLTLTFRAALDTGLF